jgi:hypothetical protein
MTQLEDFKNWLDGDERTPNIIKYLSAITYRRNEEIFEITDIEKLNECKENLFNTNLKQKRTIIGL